MHVHRPSGWWARWCPPILFALLGGIPAATPVLAARPALAPGTPRTALPTGDLTGTVSDAASAEPLVGAEVTVATRGHVVADLVTDAFGRFIAHDLQPGSYTVRARLLGYSADSVVTTIPEGGGGVTVAIRLGAAPLGLAGLAVTVQAPLAVDTRTGDQVYQQHAYHGAPSNTTSQILQQSIAGAARAPTGEVHIRGQHAEYTYYVDGVPVPPGISGSLNELFQPAIVNRITFQTGGWDAEYGNDNAAIINVQTKVPAGGFHADLGGYGGSYGENGQTLSLSGHTGRWGWFLSGTRQGSNMRQNPVAFDTLTDAPFNYHNHGTDYFTFGKVEFVPSNRDRLNVDVNWSRTRFQVPFDSVEGLLDDRQRDINSFLTAGWRHRFGSADSLSASEEGSDLFVGLYARHGSLAYTPGALDQPTFVFYPDTTPLIVRENRSFDTYGVRADYHVRVSHAAEFKLGTEASTTSGREDFSTVDATGSPGPASNSGLDGHDFGVYAQTALTPAEWLELRTGVRYDEHAAPFAGTRRQVSPRVKLSLFAGQGTTFSLYYGRLFMPTHIEDLRAITTVSLQGDTTSTSPTLPERDDFFEADLIHRFPLGIVAKLSGYIKNASPGVDDNTVQGTAIVTPVNLAEVRVRGIEAAIEVRPPGPVSGYLNLALSHAYGRGPVTGGFFPTDVAAVPGGWFDLDHDQRVSAVGSATYSANRFFLSATGIYGSGLANGADLQEPIGRGLFDFNPGIHVDPNFILNGAAGYSFGMGPAVVSPQLYVNNVLGTHYLLKGAFFSGASVGRPRSVEVRLNVAY
ncbi:MAG: TonB-dependent receptor [Candidatus Palauibacterales bacterium]|nr:TonB-dependent receptor [Candidatus Palauibacterales bacterium]MDP2530828.1 TonB-dependent receptor [Candidatus Palauibacterales bacterium]MDP2584366.1 TonB-dependent receptor [Candidatus Palauibacterales bacterium]